MAISIPCVTSGVAPQPCRRQRDFSNLSEPLCSTRRLLLTGLVLVVLFLGVSRSAQAETTPEVDALSARVTELLAAGKYVEALPLAESALVAAEVAHGLDDPSITEPLLKLAEVLSDLDRFADALRHEQRALAIRDKRLGPAHLDTIAAMMAVAGSLSELHRYDDAEVLAHRALEALERTRGGFDPALLGPIDELADLYGHMARGDQAEAMLRRALALREKAFGSEHIETGRSLVRLADRARINGREGEAEALYARAIPIIEKQPAAHQPWAASALVGIGMLCRGQGRIDDGEKAYRRAIAIYEASNGPDSREVASAVFGLAALLHATRPAGEVVELYERALAIQEKVLGERHVETATSLNSLAEVYLGGDRYDKAEPLFRRALAAREAALEPDIPAVLRTLAGLARVYSGEGRYREAEPLLARIAAGRKTAFGPDSPEAVATDDDLAALYWNLGRFREAEALWKRVLVFREAKSKPDDRGVANALSNLAALYSDEARYSEAEPLNKRALAIRERVLGLEHPDIAISLNNLASIFLYEGRFGEAEPLYERALAIREKAFGPEHLDVANATSNLASLHHYQLRYDAAEPLYKRALSIRERALGSGHPLVGLTLNNLASLYRDQHRYAEAEPLLERALASTEASLGSQHPEIGVRLLNLGMLYVEEGRLADAEPLLERSVMVAERSLGADHPNVATSLHGLAMLHLAKQGFVRAADAWRRGTAIVRMRAAQSSVGGQDPSTGTEPSRWRRHFQGLIKAAWRIGSKDADDRARLAQEMFLAAQAAQSSQAAASLAQMAARGANGDAGLAGLVRERQDLAAEWQQKDKQLVAAKGVVSEKRDLPTEAKLGERLAAITQRIAETNSRLSSEFPEYTALANLEPISVADVQARLRADEALVLFLDTPKLDPLPEETFVWVVTQSGVRWVRSSLGSAALEREVAALRCGLDGSSWYGKGQQRCEELLGLIGERRPKDNDRLPFAASRALSLYKELFGSVEDMIAEKSLLIVPFGALARLPFQVLVTAPVKGDDPMQIRWLIRDHAITVVPAAASLNALRRDARPSQATKPFLGVGNPLLDGPDDRYAGSRAEALKRARCDELPPIKLAEVAEHRAATVVGSTDIADVAELRRAPPLPETADELCDVAHLLGAAEADVLLGARANETELRRMSDDGRLRDYRVLHFATHGALPGEATGSVEPGVLLTPPTTGSEADDGYLSASEIASLKLDADWVILSACNTAAADTSGGEALSGLARAFFYSGARSLLVSHWYVNSEATVALIQGTFSELRAHPGLGRAEALRRTMLALIDEDLAPADWAPFVIVGEGAAAR